MSTNTMFSCPTLRTTRTSRAFSRTSTRHTVPLSLLLKLELLGDLSLYNIRGAPGVAADVGPSTLEAHISHRHPTDQRLNYPRPCFRYLTERPEGAYLRHPQPRQSTVARTLEKVGTYDPTRLFGITTLDVVRASRLLSGIAGTDPAQTPVTVVGGHSGVTIVPLLSQSSTGAAVEQDREA
ncbi:hypothetical protein M422DRAFT_255492 [Sphaerobolus stellatus SS14]|uniref:Lactate/malate dehydrogenase C-terminal domain-containing protein n=1 Tax=Sphaerobolus stellatus (strain SS14) TaxID=990650 RepID=A0A0C9VJ25_SPHS4|nr:hypothetical protein M422DRAFT_255492 [Sphaerobolus stellatus SS14]